MPHRSEHRLAQERNVRYKSEGAEPVGYRPLRPGEQINVRRVLLFFVAVLLVLAIGAGIEQAFASSDSGSPTPTTVTLRGNPPAR
jgi:hypothetical protein